MKKSGKRILSFILTAVMVFALLPVFGKPMLVKAETTPTSNHAHGAYADKTCSEHAGWSEISSQADLKTLCEGGGNGYLKDSINVTETINVSSGKEVSICLNGYSITKNSDNEVFCVEGTLNLFDEVNKSGKITHEPKYKGTGLNVKKGTFNMYGGKISENTSTNDDGGGVYVNEGTFNMYGGEISENTAKDNDDSRTSDDGGGVYVYKGTFNMYGGEINNNKAHNDGGGVYENKGIINMYGGKIYKNEANYSGDGGGVYAEEGTFNMYEGEISENTAKDNDDSLTSENGGGVYVDKGTFNMYGGKIHNNEANDDGGGVFLNESSSFMMNGGKIYKNTSNNSLSDGVFTYGTFTMIGGEIKNNFVISMGEAFITDEESISQIIIYKSHSKIFFKSNDSNAKTSILIFEKYKNTKLAPNRFINPGYDFVEWKTSDEGNETSYANEAQINRDSDLTLYAQWKANSYTVKFDANGGSGTMKDMNRLYDDGSALTENEYSLDSYAFKEWNTKEDGTGKAYKDEYEGNLSSTDGDTVTLYAQWEKLYKITPTNDGNGTATASASEGKKGTVITVSATPNDGYIFANWEVVSGGVSLTDATSASTTFTLGTEDVEVKANFEELPPNEYSVTVNADANGSTSASVNSGIEGTEVTITATANDGYKFAGWQVVSGGVTLADASATTTTFNIIKENIVIKATFEEIIKEPQPGSSEPAEPSAQEPDPDPDIPEKDWLDDLRLQLRIADELGGPQTVEYSGDFALSYDIMLYLVEHPDITLIYTVTYEGVEYTITIPGGSAIADPNIPWYGPLWLLANYGGDKVPEVLAGSGKYTVVAGDTLSGIAEKFNTTVEELAKKNGIKDPNYIIVGQVIVY